MAVSTLQPPRNLNASHNLARKGLSPVLARKGLSPGLIIFHDDHLKYSHVKQTA